MFPLKSYVKASLDVGLGLFSARVSKPIMPTPTDLWGTIYVFLEKHGCLASKAFGVVGHTSGAICVC